MMTALQAQNLWDKTREAILENHGDIEPIAEIPEHIKRIYKTSFSVSPYAYVEVAARAQKWVDMGISRNMYLDVRDIDEIMNIYTTAWDKGLKTTYYLHMKPRHSAEQSTTVVNKAEALGKRGFAVLRERAKEKPVVEEKTIEESVQEELRINANEIFQKETVAVPVAVAEGTEEEERKGVVDPQEKFLCESCQ